MSEKPIILSTPMVQAILAMRKTQTRRVVKPQPKEDSPVIEIIKNPEHQYKKCWLLKTAYWGSPCDGKHVGGYWIAPKYQLGDVLWLRETWCKYEPEHVICGHEYAYKASTGIAGEDCRKKYIEAAYPYKWRPSIHMPRVAARIFLRVMDVRVERLNTISYEDVRAEGAINILEYMALWNSLNAKRGFAWESNPWVWAISFERTEVWHDWD